MAEWLGLPEAFERIAEGRTALVATSSSVMGTLLEVVPHSLLLLLVLVGLLTLASIVCTCVTGCSAAWVYVGWTVAQWLGRRVSRWAQRRRRGETPRENPPVVVGPFPVISARGGGSQGGRSVEVEDTPLVTVMTVPAPVGEGVRRRKESGSMR